MKNKTRKLLLTVIVGVLGVIVLSGGIPFPGQVHASFINFGKAPTQIAYTPRTDFNTALQLVLVSEDSLEFPNENSYIELDLINISDQTIWLPDSLNMLIGNKRKEGDTRQSSFFLNTEVGQELFLFPEGQGQSTFRIVLKPNPSMNLSSGESMPLVIGAFGNLVEDGLISESQVGAMIEMNYTFP